MCLSVLPVCMYATCMQCRGGQKSVLDPLELKLQTAGHHGSHGTSL